MSAATAPLPAVAVDALRRLELAFVSPDVVRAVTADEFAELRRKLAEINRRSEHPTR